MGAMEEKGVHRGNGVAEKEGGREGGGWKVGYSKKQNNWKVRELSVEQLKLWV